MQASNAPAKIPLPFANSGTKNTIPTASQIAITPGAASLTDGFPPVTRTPIAAGGVPPFGADMNGILFEISANTQWENAGGFYPYDATFSAAIGGYPKGALLARADLSGFWLCQTDNNTTNPDTGGAGWINPLAGRLLGVQTFTASGTYTPTPGTTQCRIRIIGGGGAGGGAAATGASTVAAGLGGNAGAYAEILVSAPTSQSVIIGAGGAAASGATGGTGGASSVGTYVSCAGGIGGATFGPTGTFPSGFGNQGNNGNPTVTGATVIVRTPGQLANAPCVFFSVSALLSGAGASSQFGEGGGGQGVGVGAPGLGSGSGGGGSASAVSTAARLGGIGAAGIVIIEDYA